MATRKDIDNLEAADDVWKLAMQTLQEVGNLTGVIGNPRPEGDGVFIIWQLLPYQLQQRWVKDYTEVPGMSLKNCDRWGWDNLVTSSYVRKFNITHSS